MTQTQCMLVRQCRVPCRPCSQTFWFWDIMNLYPCDCSFWHSSVWLISFDNKATLEWVDIYQKVDAVSDWNKTSDLNGGLYSWYPSFQEQFLQDIQLCCQLCFSYFCLCQESFCYTIYLPDLFAFTCLLQGFFYSFLYLGVLVPL